MTRLTELSRSVEGRVVLVTGAGGGQGRSTAHLFADEGAHVAVTDPGQTEVDAVVAEIIAYVYHLQKIATQKRKGARNKRGLLRRRKK